MNLEAVQRLLPSLRRLHYLGLLSHKWSGEPLLNPEWPAILWGLRMRDLRFGC